MKQKYTIKVAGMEMNVISEADQASVEKIVSQLDHRMKDISDKSRGCSKIEAAVLCALGLCSEQAQLNQDLEDVQKQLEEANRTLEDLRAKLQGQKEEIDRLKNDNDVMHAILERASTTNSFSSGNSESNTPKETGAVSVEGTADSDRKDKAKTRVGNMFDLLTFNDL